MSEQEDPIKDIEMPPDLVESLRIITGERPESFKKEFSPNTSIYPQFDGAGFMGTSAQEEFIKSKDPIEKKIRFKENKTYVLDITKPEDNVRYSEVLDLISDPESGVVLAEELKDPQVIIDANSSVGYRAIVIIKTAVPEIYIKKKSSGYTKMKKKGKEEVDS
jgi:hypothetical protein